MRRSVPLRSLLLVAVGLLVLPGRAVVAEPTVPEASQQLQQLHGRIDALRGRLDQGVALRQGLIDELREADEAIHRTLGALREVALQQEQLAAEVIELEGRADDAGHRVSTERRRLAGFLRAAHRLGRQDRLRLLLSQQQPGRVGRLMAYYRYISRVRAQRIAALDAAEQELSELRRRHREQSAALDAVVTGYQRQWRQLDAERARRAVVLDAVEQELAHERGELAGMQQQREGLQRLLRELNSLLSDIPALPPGGAPFASLMGKLPRPVPGPVRFAFGTRLRPGAEALDGVLFVVTGETEVAAVARGRVAFADWLRGQRLLIAIDHGDGYLSLYGNNDVLLREVGDWVERGEAVARSDTLSYFGLRRNGSARNPSAWWGK